MLRNAPSLDLSSKIDHVSWIDNELIRNLIFPNGEHIKNSKKNFKKSDFFWWGQVVRVNISFFGSWLIANDWTPIDYPVLATGAAARFKSAGAKPSGGAAWMYLKAAGSTIGLSSTLESLTMSRRPLVWSWPALFSATTE